LKLGCKHRPREQIFAFDKLTRHHAITAEKEIGVFTGLLFPRECFSHHPGVVQE